MKKIREIVKKNIHPKLWRFLADSYIFIMTNRLYVYYLFYISPKRQEKALKRIRKKDKIKVAFFLIHESVWKYDLVYRLMVEHPKFDPVIFVCPVVNYGKDSMLYEMNKSFTVFKNKGYNVLRTFDDITGKYLDIQKEYAPDIIFYTNPYNGLIDKRYYIYKFPTTLICYVPYAIMTTKYDSFFNLDFHNIVWKIFSETPLHHKILTEKQKIKARNSIVTGFPGFDQLLINKKPDDKVWKSTSENLKRVIWAPHHLMKELNKVSNFLEYYDYFLELANRYQDKLQIAFKPHPLLRLKLEKDPDWGKKKTDAYFEKWDILANGQLENGNYDDLFLTSDALIHDCGSFMAEYLVTGKPTLFMVRNEAVMEEWNEFGQKVVSLHYQSRNFQEVDDFIMDVVLSEKDWMKEDRKTFVREFLIQNPKSTASENILRYLEGQIFKY
ncbi:CDP-glycerol--glycerophosphate glycerophosphotransferase [Flavobacterium faecale]|uniref:CDP-glycerol--glycerophosphate glycerophosphotransferase n=1 Tax=Flavobacterium faecale TaxID=1355330 RepID=A0A2S1LDU0_9FLAO|nr:CDP-glycerol glycerophosphotransferase family protein [Flavobacterium faecale]AWG21696.1 CDP-glycerol--glycerophosphate glycerophosphotransferase [Flavobacterium faecale]